MTTLPPAVSPAAGRRDAESPNRTPTPSKRPKTPQLKALTPTPNLARTYVLPTSPLYYPKHVKKYEVPLPEEGRDGLSFGNSPAEKEMQAKNKILDTKRIQMLERLTDTGRLPSDLYEVKRKDVHDNMKKYIVKDEDPMKMGQDDELEFLNWDLDTRVEKHMQNERNDLESALRKKEMYRTHLSDELEAMKRRRHAEKVARANSQKMHRADSLREKTEARFDRVMEKRYQEEQKQLQKILETERKWRERRDKLKEAEAKKRERLRQRRQKKDNKEIQKIEESLQREEEEAEYMHDLYAYSSMKEKKRLEQVEAMNREKAEAARLKREAETTRVLAQKNRMSSIVADDALLQIAETGMKEEWKRTNGGRDKPRKQSPKATEDGTSIGSVKRLRTRPFVPKKKCGLCNHLFGVDQLCGVATYKSIMELQQKWGVGDKKVHSVRSKSVGSLYNRVMLCVFCFQYFDMEPEEYETMHKELNQLALDMWT